VASSSSLDVWQLWARALTGKNASTERAMQRPRGLQHHLCMNSAFTFIELERLG